MNFKLLLISAEFLGGIYGNLRILGIGKLGILHFRKTDWHGKAYSGSSPSSAFGQVNWYLQTKSTLWLQNKCLLLCFFISNCLNLSHHHAVGEVHKYLQKKTLWHMRINDCWQPWVFRRGVTNFTNFIPIYLNLYNNPLI